MVESRSGPARIVGSGTATTFGGHGLDLQVRLPERYFTVALTFVDDPSVADVEVRSTTSEDGLHLECVNFRGPDGRGSAQPVLLCDLGDDLLFLHFRAFLYGRTVDQTVTWTVFRVAKDAVGWTPVGAGG